MKHQRATQTMDYLSYRMKARRRALGMSKAGLARRAGLAKETIHLVDYARREPYLSTAKQIAVALNISLDYLVGLKD